MFLAGKIYVVKAKEPEKPEKQYHDKVSFLYWDLHVVKPIPIQYAYFLRNGVGVGIFKSILL